MTISTVCTPHVLMFGSTSGIDAATSLSCQGPESTRKPTRERCGAAGCDEMSKVAASVVGVPAKATRM